MLMSYSCACQESVLAMRSYTFSVPDWCDRDRTVLECSYVFLYKFPMPHPGRETLGVGPQTSCIHIHKGCPTLINGPAAEVGGRRLSLECAAEDWWAVASIHYSDDSHICFLG